ncbi:MAG: hypothetical protein QM529_05755 [Hydrotalea sp.]|nr:hypothetical protein [Hydrotalea sp.]
MIKKIILILLLLVGGASRAMANDWRPGFFSGVSSEATIFPKDLTRSTLVAPTIGIESGYHAKGFSVVGGFTYYFYNFYGQRDMLVHFGAAYKLRFNIANNSFFSLGLGSSVARNLLTGYVRLDGQTIYFLIPNASMDISIDKYVISIISKIYVPMKFNATYAYSIGGAVGVAF